MSEPQAGIRRHTGVGFELVLNPFLPQLAREDERQVAEEWVELVDERTGVFLEPALVLHFLEPSQEEEEEEEEERIPRTSSSRSTPGRARRRQQQWHAPGDVAGMQVVQVLPSRWPLGCHDRCPAYVPQLPLINKVVDITVVAQRPFPLVR